MIGHYILIGHTAHPVSDIQEWAKWFEKANRVIRRTRVGFATISTIFLGMDHGFGEERPLLFETMVFSVGYKYNNATSRHCTWDEAVEGHLDMLAEVMTDGLLPEEQF